MVASGNPLPLQIGLVFPSMGHGSEVIGADEIASELRGLLASQFPAFRWEVEVAASRGHTEDELRDPLHLVETAFREKVARGWDACVFVADVLVRGATRPFAVAIPASALEVGIASRALFAGEPRKTAVLILHLLARLWGVARHSGGTLTVPERIEEIVPPDFSADQIGVLEERLSETADARLEENPAAASRRNVPLFYLQSLAANPRGIVDDVVGYRPWWQPFRLARLTAAAVVSMLFIFLGAEAWEIGFHLSPAVLICGAILAVFGSAAAIYSGQNLSEIAPVGALTEQLARTRIVLFFCVFIGMVSLGAVLFAVSFGVASLLPAERIEAWTGTYPSTVWLIRFSTFSAMLGVLAGALGGNLEENDELKARFFFDEEIQ